jgi:hypothetical protein
MQRPLVLLAVTVAMIIVPMAANGQTVPSNISPLSQPLIREGTLAVQLADDLGLAKTDNEAQAEDLLDSAGIAPKNGWIADYPVTPDIVVELQASVGAAADSGKLSMDRNTAIRTLQSDISSYNLPVSPDTSGQYGNETYAPEYPDTSAEDSYYSSPGPPVVTYYAPPPDYAYLYTWVDYPFWWSNFWFPGFFVLADFHIKTHWHHHGHEYTGYVTNHYGNSSRGYTVRIDPATRHLIMTQPNGELGKISPQRREAPSANIQQPGRAPQAQVPSVASPSQVKAPAVISPAPQTRYRGYGTTPNPIGQRTSVFENSVNRQVEHAASERGSQSRSNAGYAPQTPHYSAPATARGGGGGGGGSHGGQRR